MAMRAPVALAALAFAASAAWAEERAVVVVDATGDGRGAPVVARLNAALGAAPDLAPIAPTLIDALAVATPTDAGPLAAATAALAQAREHMARFASGEALAVAQAAIDAGAAAAGDPEVRAVLAELAFVEGLALADGELAAARPAWTLAHALAPGRTLDPARYPPEQVAAFAAAATPAPGSGAVMIAAPGAAEVLIDGAVIGREPAVAQLAPGPHLVTARGDDIAPVGRRVVAAAGQTVRVDLVPVLEVPTLRAARARDRLRAAADDGARFAALVALLAVGGADDAILVVDGGAGLATRLYTKAGGLGPATPFTDDLGAVLRALRPLPPVEPPRPPVEPPRPPPIPEVPWYERRWARIGMGSVGGLVVLAVVVAIVTRGEGETSLAGTIEVQ